jgi:hypothetical protein
VTRDYLSAKSQGGGQDVECKIVLFLIQQICLFAMFRNGMYNTIITQATMSTTPVANGKRDYQILEGIASGKTASSIKRSVEQASPDVMKTLQMMLEHNYAMHEDLGKMQEKLDAIHLPAAVGDECSSEWYREQCCAHEGDARFAFLIMAKLKEERERVDDNIAIAEQLFASSFDAKKKHHLLQKVYDTYSEEMRKEHCD